MYQMVDRAVGHLAHTFLNTKKTPKLMEFHDLTQKLGLPSSSAWKWRDAGLRKNMLVNVTQNDNNQMVHDITSDMISKIC